MDKFDPSSYEIQLLAALGQCPSLVEKCNCKMVSLFLTLVDVLSSMPCAIPTSFCRFVATHTVPTIFRCCAVHGSPFTGQCCKPMCTCILQRSVHHCNTSVCHCNRPSTIAMGPLPLQQDLCHCNTSCVGPPASCNILSAIATHFSRLICNTLLLCT